MSFKSMISTWAPRSLRKYMYKIDYGDSYDTGVGGAHSDNNEEGGINIEIV